MCTHGAFAEKVLVQAKQIIPMPPAIGFETAASFTLAYGTSYHALKGRAQLKEGETQRGCQRVNAAATVDGGGAKWRSLIPGCTKPFLCLFFFPLLDVYVYVCTNYMLVSL